MLWWDFCNKQYVIGIMVMSWDFFVNNDQTRKVVESLYKAFKTNLNILKLMKQCVHKIYIIDFIS